LLLILTLPFPQEMKNRKRMRRIIKEKGFLRFLLAGLNPGLILVFVLCLSASICGGQTLEDYLAKGLKNSPFLKDYSIQLQSQSIDSLKILAGFKPQAGVSADLNYPPAFGRFAYDSAITDGGHYTALVRVEQSLLFRKVAEVRLQSVFIQKLTTENSRKITETELREGITAQYITAYSDLIQVKFDKTIIGMLKDQQKGLKLLVEKGIYQQTDYLNLAYNIGSQQIKSKQSYRQYKNDLAILNLLCGIHDTATVELVKPEIFVQNAFDINNSPNMIQFRIDSLKSVNEHLLIDLDYKPRLGIYADAGINAIKPRRIPYNLGTSVGLSFTMPLYDGKQRHLDHQRVSLSENTRANFKSFFETRYQQQKDQLFEQLMLSEDLLSEMKAQITSLEKLLSLYEVEINKGMVRWLDYLTVVNNYAQVRNEQTQAEISRLQIINQLNYLK
jgi:outer membrane protein TolC